MKKLFLCLTLIIGFSVVNAQTKFPKSNLVKSQEKAVETKKKASVPVVGDMPIQEKKLANATIDFESKVVDYGVIEHKADGVRKFVFKCLYG